MTRTPDEVVGDLIVARQQLGQITAQHDELLERRRTLFVEGRSITPPISYERLGVAAGVSHAAVRKTMSRTTNTQESQTDADRTEDVPAGRDSPNPTGGS